MKKQLAKDALVMEKIVIGLAILLALLLSVASAHAGVESVAPDTPQEGTWIPDDDSLPATPGDIRRYMEEGYPYDGPPPPNHYKDWCENERWYNHHCGPTIGA